MPAPEATQTLQQLVAAFEAKGASALRELNASPTLIQCSGEVPGDALGYETVAVVSWDTRVVLAMAKSGARFDPDLLARAGAVFPVAKRPGGPFPDRIGVGRARTADIALRAPSVSKYHAYFTKDERGRWFIWDARSRNGTRVGGQAIEPGKGVELGDDTPLSFGDEACLFLSAASFRSLISTLAAG